MNSQELRQTLREYREAITDAVGRARRSNHAYVDECRRGCRDTWIAASHRTYRIECMALARKLAGERDTLFRQALRQVMNDARATGWPARDWGMEYRGK